MLKKRDKNFYVFLIHENSFYYIQVQSQLKQFGYLCYSLIPQIRTKMFIFQDTFMKHVATSESLQRAGKICITTKLSFLNQCKIFKTN